MSTDHTTDTTRGNGFGRAFLAALVWAGAVVLVLPFFLLVRLLTVAGSL